MFAVVHAALGPKPASSKTSRPRSTASPYLLPLLPRATSRRWYAARVYASPHTLTASRYAARASHHQTPSLAPCSPCGVCGSSFSLANGFARAQRSYLHQHHELLPPPPRGRAAQRRAWRAPHVDRRQVRTIRRSSRCVALRVLSRSLSSLRAESGAERYFWQRQRQVNRYSRSRSRVAAQGWLGPRWCRGRRSRRRCCRRRSGMGWPQGLRGTWLASVASLRRRVACEMIWLTRAMLVVVVRAVA